MLTRDRVCEHAGALRTTVKSLVTSASLPE
jgi:hypothetical protein